MLYLPVTGIPEKKTWPSLANQISASISAGYNHKIAPQHISLIIYDTFMVLWYFARTGQWRCYLWMLLGQDLYFWNWYALFVCRLCVYSMCMCVCVFCRFCAWASSQALQCMVVKRVKSSISLCIISIRTWLEPFQVLENINWLTDQQILWYKIELTKFTLTFAGLWWSQLGNVTGGISNCWKYSMHFFFGSSVNLDENKFQGRLWPLRPGHT